MGEYADLEVDEIIAGFERRAEKQVAKKDLKPNQCEVCGKRFWTSEARSQHAKDSHKAAAKTERIEEDSEWANGQMTVGEEQDFGA